MLLVDDSVTQREILRRLLTANGEFIVIAEARNGREAVALTAQHRPDLVLMDVHMPDMDGVAATEEIMRRTPVPIVIATAALKRADVDVGMQALQAGAVAVIEKPQGAVLLHLEKIAPSLRRELLAAAKARVARRPPPQARCEYPSLPVPPVSRLDEITVIGLCASTGGPPVLLDILSRLPKPYPLPILLVQHIAAGFVAGFARWLGELSGQTVRVATGGEMLQPGVWLSPGGKHLTLGMNRRIHLIEPHEKELHCPSANVLLESLAKQAGQQALGIILTGMGSDGADGLLALRKAGGQTIAQDEATSLIYGMPKVAVERGAVEFQLPPAKIATALVEAGEQHTRHQQEANS